MTITFFNNSNYFIFKNFYNFEIYVNQDNLRGPQRRPYSLIYILTAFLYVAGLGWLPK